MALVECRTAEDVRRLAKRNDEWRRQQYKQPEPPVTVAPPTEAEMAPEPFIPPAPRFTPRMVTIERLQNSARVMLKDAINLVCDRYGVSGADVVSMKREASICRPRQVVMWLGRNVLKRTLPEIGRALGGRDHTTVISGVRKIDCLRESDPVLQQQLDDLAAALGPERFWAD